MLSDVLVRLQIVTGADHSRDGVEIPGDVDRHIVNERLSGIERAFVQNDSFSRDTAANHRANAAIAER
jgi:hypothetical protein